MASRESHPLRVQSGIVVAMPFLVLYPQVAGAMSSALKRLAGSLESHKKQLRRRSRVISKLKRTNRKKTRRITALLMHQFFQEAWRAAADRRARLLEVKLAELIAQRLPESAEAVPASMAAQVKAIIVEQLSQVPEIEYVLYRKEGSVNIVVSVIGEFDPTLRHKIYKYQKLATAQLPGTEFDFYIVTREKRDPAEFLPTNMEVLHKRLATP